MKTIFIAKYALKEGIYEISHYRKVGETIYFKLPSQKDRWAYNEGGHNEWFYDKEKAIEKVKILVGNKITSIKKKQILLKYTLKSFSKALEITKL